jgi:hypothetical protein
MELKKYISLGLSLLGNYGLIAILYGVLKVNRSRSVILIQLCTGGMKRTCRSVGPSLGYISIYLNHLFLRVIFLQTRVFLALWGPLPSFTARQRT